MILRGDRRVIDRAEAADQSTPDGAAKQKLAGRRPWTATVFHVSQTDPAK